MTFEFKATEQYFPVVLFIMMYSEVVLPFESGSDKILKCDHSNEVLLCNGTVLFVMLF